jgi:DNA-binding NarL/FixJ family response regulator
MMLIRIPPADLHLLATGKVSRHAALLRMSARGASRADIARSLDVSTRTVDRWLAELRRQLGAATTAELASKLTEAGW